MDKESCDSIDAWWNREEPEKWDPLERVSYTMFVQKDLISCQTHLRFKVVQHQISCYCKSVSKSFFN